ncbi:MAG: hypothetical protein ACKOAY_13595 [Haliscomenobacter sp.]
MKKILVLTGGILLIMGLVRCHPFQKRALLGHWGGTSLTAQGDSLALDPSDIHLTFLSKNRYEFLGTLKYKEQGTFRLEGNLLYTLDTSRAKAKEKAVEILMLSKDSLHFRMNEDGQERILKLKKLPKH